MRHGYKQPLHQYGSNVMVALHLRKNYSLNRDREGLIDFF